MDNEAGKKRNSEEDLREAVETFEQILEAMPSDRLALETLSDAYEQLGDYVKALEYYVRLGTSVVEENDKAAAPAIVKKLETLGAGKADAAALVSSLKKLSDPEPEAKETPASKKPRITRRRAFDITAELALAWNLVQAGELAQDEYASVVHDLTESSSRPNEVPVTVLHVLRDRGFKNYEKILTFLSQNSGLPIIPLTGFEMQKDAYTLLPEPFMKQRGAIIFELMGSEALVAILNPYDTELRKEIEEMTGRKCHYFVVSAEDYDRTLDTVHKAMVMAQGSTPPPS